MFRTTIETAEKHSVNVYHYFYDRMTQKYEISSLVNLIKSVCKPDQLRNQVFSLLKAA